MQTTVNKKHQNQCLLGAAIYLYNEGIESASKNEFILYEASHNELVVKCWLNQDQPKYVKM